MAIKKKKDIEYKPQGMTEIKDIPRVEVPAIKLPAQTQTQTPPVKTATPQVRRNETGKIVGVILPDGRDITASPIEVKGLIENWKIKQAPFAGTVEAADVIAQKQKIEEARLLAGQVGKVPEMTPERYAEITADLTPEEQRIQGLPGALREGTTQAGSRAITFGAAGAAAGLVPAAATAGLSVPVGAGIGAVAGIVSGYWSALRGARKAEAKEDVGNTMAEFTALKRGMTNVATLTTSNQINPYEAVELFNAQYSRMIELQARLKYLTDSELKDYLSDGSANLITVTTYLEQVVPAYRVRIQTGLINPNAATIPYSDVFTEEE